jgi:tetratricopeptide (TPR) repeat protein
VNTVSVIVNYCSLEREFLPAVLDECAHFASEIVVSFGSHLYDGTLEDAEHMESLWKQYTSVKFVQYKVDIGIDLMRQKGVERRPHAYWHNLARWTGLQAVKMSQWVLFLDADEIPDGLRMRAWLEQTTLGLDICYHLANYWYFKSPNNQALTWEQSSILMHCAGLTDADIFSDQERDNLGFMRGIQNRDYVTGLDSLPLIHHLSWVRSKSILLKKLNTWGHKDQIRDPVKYVDYIFWDSNINDKIHQYRYRYVYNKFHIYINSDDVSYPLKNPSHEYFKGLRNENRNSDNSPPQLSEGFFLAIDLYFDNKLNESVEVLHNIAHDATEPEVYDFLGFVMLSFGNYTAAGDFFCRALALEPRHARSFFHLGLSAHYTGDYFNAIQNFTKAINLEPLSFEYYYYNACALLNVDSADFAILGWESAERLDNSYYGTQFNLGLASIRTGDTERAKAYLEMTLILNPQFSSAGRLLAQLK